MKKVTFFVVSLIMAFSSINLAFASIMINKTMDKPLDGFEEYDAYIRDILYNNKFYEETDSVTAETKEIIFEKDACTIIYRDLEKTNIYKGTFGIRSGSLSVTINEIYESNKFGFYEQKLLNETLIVNSELVIGEEDIRLILSSETKPEINSYFQITEENKTVTKEQIETFTMLNDDLWNTFKLNNAWKMDIYSPAYQFSNIYFTGGDNINLVDETNINNISIIQGKFSFSDFTLSVKPTAFYRIDKINGNFNYYTVNESSNLPEVIEFKIQYDSGNNKYYISPVDDIYNVTNIKPTKFSSFSFSIDHVDKASIENHIRSGIIKMNSAANEYYFNFKKDNTFSARLNDGEVENCVNGTYTVESGKISLKFKLESYIDFKNGGNALYFVSDSTMYDATINVSKINKDKFFGSFSLPENSGINITKDKFLYMNMQLDNSKSTDIPVSMTDLKDMTGRVFEYVNDKTGEVIKISLNKDGTGIYSISNNGVLEKIEGTLSIQNGEIKITNSDDKYNHGDYNNYFLGTQKNKSTKTMSVSFYPKQDPLTKEIYFAVFDGLRTGSKYQNDEYNYKTELRKTGPYYGFNEVKNIEFISFNNIDRNDLKSLINGKNFVVNYTRDNSNVRHVEKIQFYDGGKVNVFIEDTNMEINKLSGTYSTDNGSIKINYNASQNYKNGIFTESTDKNTYVMKVVIDSFSNDLYLKVSDNVYLKLNLSTEKFDTTIPIIADKDIIKDKLYDNYIYSKASGAPLEFLIRSNGTVKKYDGLNEYTGEYKTEDGKITMVFEDGKKEIYDVRFDNNNFYLSLKDNKYNIFPMNEFEPVQ